MALCCFQKFIDCTLHNNISSANSVRLGRGYLLYQLLADECLGNLFEIIIVFAQITDFTSKYYKKFALLKLFAALYIVLRSPFKSDYLVVNM